jgi:hypothetical protein
MLRPLLARITGRRPRHPECQRPPAATKTRLRVEALEPREVPAHLVWTNATGSGYAGAAANWLNLGTGAAATVGPTGGDDLYFDGDVSGANCHYLSAAMTTGYVNGYPTPMPGEYRSVNLIDGYAGTVATSSGFRTATLVVESGALFQTCSSADLLVSRTLYWTGGTLGGSHANTATGGFTASNSTVRLLAGSTATIAPGDGNAVATGSTLSFETANGVGSSGTFASGRLNFVGGTGLVIDSLCTVTAQARPAAATFVDTPQPGAAAKFIQIKTGGKMFVRSAAEAEGGTFESALPVMNYGTLQVEKLATAVIRGAVPFGEPVETRPSVWQQAAGAAIRIENGSKLVTEKGLSLIGGKLTTLAKADPPQNFSQTATIAGKVSLSGGEVSVCAGGDSHVFGTLVFEGDVWLGGVTLRVVVDGRAPGSGDAGKSDLYDFKAHLLDGIAQPVVKVTTVNAPEAGLNQNQMWEFVRAAHPIEADEPTVVSETSGTSYQVFDTEQNSRWCFKPTP